MAVYMIIETEVKDQKMFAQYLEKAKGIVLSHGGKYLTRGGKVISLSSDWKPQRLTIIEFPAIQNVKECFNSWEYKSICCLREDSAHTRAIVIEGC